jgi:uncharacterized membrane protein HdeD (DUF308 family)
MLGLMAHEWRMFALRGVAAIVFGILALVWPGKTLQVLVLLFGAYALVDGIAMLVALIRGDAAARQNGWAVALIGVTGIIAGVVTFFWPGLTAMSLLYVVAFWAIATGVFQVAAAIALRREIDGELWMVLGGVLSIVFGGLLIAYPSSGLISLVWLLGGWAILFGGANLGLAYGLHGIDASLRPPVAAQ